MCGPQQTPPVAAPPVAEPAPAAANGTAAAPAPAPAPAAAPIVGIDVAALEKVKASAAQPAPHAPAPPLVQASFDVAAALGQGGFAVVWKATERSSGKPVAIKQIVDAFRSDLDARRTYREIVLQRACDCEQILPVAAVLSAAPDVMLVLPCADTDVHTALRAKLLQKASQKQHVCVQMLLALEYLHARNVVHRDIKPPNLLLDAATLRVRLCDFGLARLGGGSGSAPIGATTDEIGSRWYRAPELLLGCAYTCAVDLWSAGCVVAEVLTCTTLMQGSTDAGQLQRVVELLGAPDEEARAALVPEAGAAEQLDAAQRGAEAQQPKRDFARQTRGAPEQGKQLVRELLALDPAKRLAARAARQHAYLLPAAGSYAAPKGDDDAATAVKPLELPLADGLAATQYEAFVRDHVAEQSAPEPAAAATASGGEPAVEEEDMGA